MVGHFSCKSVKDASLYVHTARGPSCTALQRLAWRLFIRLLYSPNCWTCQFWLTTRDGSHEYFIELVVTFRFRRGEEGGSSSSNSHHLGVGPSIKAERGPKLAKSAKLRPLMSSARGAYFVISSCRYTWPFMEAALQQQRQHTISGGPNRPARWESRDFNRVRTFFVRSVARRSFSGSKLI